MKALRNFFLTLMEGVRFYFCTCPRFPQVRPGGWWKRWFPSRKYIEFRMHTAYGMKEHDWPRPKTRTLASDIMRFLAWRRRYRLEQKAREG